MVGKKAGEVHLRLPKTATETIERHAEREYPSECCGVLLGASSGEGSAVAEVVTCRNMRIEHSAREYEIDPGELIAVQRTARERGMNIVGFYHSHPEHPARWSPSDLEQAHWTGCSYVILSVSAGRAKEMASFRLLVTAGGEKQFQEELIVS
jgi:proteasome lid subunit RPN8/RPN11